MKAASETEKQIVVIGGGYIGLESAAVLNKAGKKVVLLRVAGEELSRFYEKEHRDHGVELHLGDCVDAIDGTDRVTGVRLSDGEIIPADLVIVRSEEHTSELQSLMRISYAVFCWKNTKPNLFSIITQTNIHHTRTHHLFDH